MLIEKSKHYERSTFRCWQRKISTANAKKLNLYDRMIKHELMCVVFRKWLGNDRKANVLQFICAHAWSCKCKMDFKISACTCVTLEHGFNERFPDRVQNGLTQQFRRSQGFKNFCIPFVDFWLKKKNYWYYWNRHSSRNWVNIKC